MDAGRQLDAYNAGAAGRIPTGGTPEEEAAWQAGAASSGRGSGFGGAGMLLLVPAILFAIPAIVIGTCLFPLAGILTLLAGAMIAGLFDDGRVGTLVVIAVVLVPCILVFFASLRLERMLERYRPYRAARHVARLVAVGFVVHVTVFAFTGAGHFAPGTPFMDRISLLHVAIVAAAVVAAHFGSRRLDAGIGRVDGFRARLRLARRPA